MALPTHILVTAPDGRRTPVDARDGVEPGGGQLCVTSDVVCRVRYSHTTVRSVGRRDLILCDMDGNPVDSVELAAAPAEFCESKIAKRSKTARPKVGQKGDV